MNPTYVSRKGKMNEELKQRLDEIESRANAARDAWRRLDSFDDGLNTAWANQAKTQINLCRQDIPDLLQIARDALRREESYRTALEEYSDMNHWRLEDAEWRFIPWTWKPYHEVNPHDIARAALADSGAEEKE